MLKEVFAIGKLKETAGQFSALIEFNAEHPMFAGHFEGNPMVPAVFQMEILRTAAERALNTCLKTLAIERATVDFPVVPTESATLSLVIQEQSETTFQLEGQIAQGGNIAMRLKMSCQPI